VRIATGTLRFAHPGTLKIRIKPTRAGKPFLKRHAALTLIAKGTFTPHGRPPVAASHEFILRN
jgi:hypothetical protein